MTKEEIIKHLKITETENASRISELHDKCSITDYSSLVTVNGRGNEIWTKAFQRAVDEHEWIEIPSRDTPYYIDNSIIIPSNRHIFAYDGAVIRAVPEMKVLMLRNLSTADGTKAPITGIPKDTNISIEGGTWEESLNERRGYGKSGMYDEDRSFYGVSTCMLFNNMEGLTLKNMTIANCGGFAVQAGDIKNVFFENITFRSCFADGLHINGNTENLVARNIAGEVGDDIIALNMYDWQNSSVNFGKTKNVLCENITLAPTGQYKAIRIEPGTYYYENGDSVDCSLENAIFKGIRGIKTFKLYYQTPSYCVHGAPEKGGVGSADSIYFEDIEIELTSPIDNFGVYKAKDPIRGTFAGFELGAMIGSLHFEDINVILDREEYPTAYFLCIGPKTNRSGDGNMETFDPGISSCVKNLYLKNIRVNGETDTDVREYIKEIVFDDIYGDGTATGRGKIENITVE